MSSIFGGSKTKSSSSNQAYPYLKDQFAPVVQTGVQSNNALANLLGLNGQPAQTQGFDNWRNSTGYQFGFDQGQKAITGNAATAGLLNSGSTAKALTQFGNDYGSQKFGDYFNQLMGLFQGGLGAGGLISNSGQTSNTSGKSGGGVGGFVGQVLKKR